MRAELTAVFQAGRVRLANLLESLWDRPVREYSAGLWDFAPRVPLEPELAGAFECEFARLGWRPEECASTRKALDQGRVLQTATHLTASEGPTFLAVHQVATAGLPADRPYLVGAYSGVPFSNPAWSGCLNYSHRHSLDALIDPDTDLYRQLSRDAANREADLSTGTDRRLSLVPSRLRDGLVFGAQTPDRMHQVASHLTPVLREVLPEQCGEDFCDWALAASQRVARRVLGAENLFYFDLNRVVASYLTRVIGVPDHPMHRLLFSPEKLGRLLAALGQRTNLFAVATSKGKRQRVGAVRLEGERLIGPGVDLPREPGALLDGLSGRGFCPGVLLTFCCLTFLNGFRCLGSFEQIEYLARFQKALSDQDWPEPGFAARADVDALTTGRCVDLQGDPVYPLDLVLGTDVRLSGDGRIGDWVTPLLPRLAGMR